MSHSIKIGIQMQFLNLLLTTVRYFPEAPVIKGSPCSFMYSFFIIKKLGPCFSDKRARIVATLRKQVNSLRTNDSEAQPAGADSSGGGRIAPKPQGIHGQVLGEWAGFGRDRYPPLSQAPLCGVPQRAPGNRLVTVGCNKTSGIKKRGGQKT